MSSRKKTPSQGIRCPRGLQLSQKFQKTNFSGSFVLSSHGLLWLKMGSRLKILAILAVSIWLCFLFLGEIRAVITVRYLEEQE